jgi:shikimate kinase
MTADRRLIVFVGPPGAGKSTIGRAVAAHLGVEFRDTDEDIVATANKSIADIFLDDGEPRFRELERAAVATALAEHDGVLAVGGGAVLDPATRSALSGHTVVWLDVRLTDAVSRVGLGASRPVLALNPRATLATLLAERAPLYAEVATIHVHTDGLSVDEVSEAVVRELEASRAGR